VTYLKGIPFGRKYHLASVLELLQVRETREYPRYSSNRYRTFLSTDAYYDRVTAVCAVYCSP